ncbi:MAG: hypothetical protein ACXWPM_09340, partial [Bdellovibrionota bacterium]
IVEEADPPKDHDVGFGFSHFLHDTPCSIEPKQQCSESFSPARRSLKNAADQLWFSLSGLS